MQDEKTKHVAETLEEQYKTEKYGKLHRALLKHGIRTELYVGEGIEMHYPYLYKPILTLQVLDDENLVVLYKHEPKLKDESRIIQEIWKVAKSLKYKVMQINELSEEESKPYFCRAHEEDYGN
jgi:hypothetical protein